MKPINIEKIGVELAIKWEDDSESFIRLEALRKACPCASCKGEMDVMGKVYKGPARPYQENSFRLADFTHVGGYAIRFIWADGHNTGLYAFDYLQDVAREG